MNAAEIYDKQNRERCRRIADMCMNEARRALPGRPENSIQAAARHYSRCVTEILLERQS